MPTRYHGRNRRGSAIWHLDPPASRPALAPATPRTIGQPMVANVTWQDHSIAAKLGSCRIGSSRDHEGVVFFLLLWGRLLGTKSSHWLEWRPGLPAPSKRPGKRILVLTSAVNQHLWHHLNLSLSSRLFSAQTPTPSTLVEGDRTPSYRAQSTPTSLPFTSSFADFILQFSSYRLLKETPTLRMQVKSI